MKKQTVFKKLISSIMVAIIVLGQFSSYRFVSEAVTIDGGDGPIYLSLSKTNQEANNEIGYANQAGEPIYNIMSSGISSSNLYCIKAEYSNTWNDSTFSSQVEYNWSDNFDNGLENTPSTVVNGLVTGEYFNEILWIVDNMYIPGESNLDKFLEQADIGYNIDEGGYVYISQNGHNYYEDIDGIGDVYQYTLTNDDIIAIQQAAIWYFTNGAGENGDNNYNSKNIVSWLRYTTDGNEYKTFNTNIKEEAAREVFSYVLYNYLIDEAEKATADLANGEYELKNTTAKLWLSTLNGADNQEQPVIEVHKKFDLSLRKNITKVNGEEVDTRKPNIDTENLKDGTDTTAEYNHRKDAVSVQNGDTVEYDITIYNEGSIDGVASVIKDALPTGLTFDLTQFTQEGNEYIATSSKGNKYVVTYDETNNIVTFTLKETEIANIELIAAYGNGDTLEKEVITLECEVNCEINDENIYLTNIAYIYTAIRYDGTENGTIVTSQKAGTEKDSEADRDSEPYTYPGETADELKTTGDDVGYIGDETANANKNLSDNVYFEGEQDDDDFEKLVIIPQSFDLSLRKTIVEVKDSEGNNKNVVNTEGNNATRVVTVDETPLTDETDKTTANYNHRKDPVVVETGDTVKYAITIYNECEMDGYASVIKDQLPGTWGSGLRLQSNNGTVESTTGNIYNIQYDTTNNIVVLTMADNSPKNVIPAYDGEGEPASETIYVECKVMGNPSAESQKVLTNIAYIAQEYNAENNTIEDRDSEPEKIPQANTLITDDIGYTGKDTNPTDSESLSSNDTYYEGQEDDDDFEKVVILPVSFDLSLRKNITKVNGEAVDTRTPNIDTENLKDGTDTTAEYNHRKDAVSVKDGDTVEYNITIYNEGSIDGVASIIRDGLPTGLTFDLTQFTQEGNEYITTSSKGNKYVVTYDETNNIVTFTLKETEITNIKLLSAYGNGENLDQDVITLECEVDCKADDDQNIYLTNIAYIYTAVRYDGDKGTIVTNQKYVTDNGKNSEADRDSEPYTHPTETAENLKTTGNVGYIGDETSNSNNDLSQNVYFKGEQDDDDFEKLVILPESFDLSLRKYITKVTDAEGNETAITNRTPETDTTNLNNGTDTTAEYNHRKDAVTVEDGSKVEYSISIYNEGSIDGIATIIRDQLPTGLKLNLDYFAKEGEKYYATSLKGNVYEVSYDENTNLVTFKLDETKTSEPKLLVAYEEGNNLDDDVIVLECEVNCIADQEQNTYFTNIAYIYEAKQEDGTVITTQTSGNDSDRDSQPHTYPEETAEELKTIGNIGYTGNSQNSDDLAQDDVYFEGEQDDDDFEKLVMLPKTFDLKLIKFISEVNGEETGNRVLDVDTSKLNTSKTETTADYILEKNPVSVKAGDFVTYTLRVYNEGNYDGYATEISENIPEGLEFIVVADGIIYSWDGVEQKDITEEIQSSDMYQEILNINSNWGYSLDSSVITTNALSEDLIKAFGKENVEYADSENKIDYKEIQVIFRVKEDVEANVTIRNEAAISQDKAVDYNGEEINIPDRDSTPDEWKKENSDETYDEEGKWPIYEEDDEDYDNIVTKAFDLSLRKQIIKINDALYTNRYSTLLDSVKEQEDTKTLYDYYDVYSDKPKVKAGDKVTYSIRVYNEGDIDGYASLIVDTLPEGLEFVEYEPGDGSINDKYGWTLVDGTEKTYQTDYLSYEKDVNKGTSKSTILKAYDGEGEASYQEIYIECRIKEDATKEDSLLNVAQIAEDSDEDGKPIKDKDSIPGTSDDENKWKEEDDLDIEILQLQEFDLALRKFITQIENGENIEKVTTRIPKASYDAETKQIVYTHPKDALVVHVGDTVIYTLRIYNEGDIDGYASEIKDDIPEYLEYLPEHNTNQEYKWVMYDKDGNVTENVEEAVYIKTEYLSKENGEENLIKAFDPEVEISETNPDYKEIKVAFEVKDPNSTEYEIVNFAQISDDTDSEGEPIDDRDSETDNGEGDPKEDDEDIEKVKVEYFDLSLLKYVTKVLVNENGEERTIETGNVGDENDIIPHIQINKKNINNTVVKFVYTIEIKNEGQIAGEATEITDYVPEGLVFVEEDNQFWTDEGNNVISTKQLTGTTLEPGETVQVEVVLRWINGADNLGAKTNVAEISEDYNEENVPDRDSTPDNKVDGEDDIDDATVLLSVNQGGGIQSIYINLSLAFLVIILIGAILIKKFVL